MSSVEPHLLTNESRGEPETGLVSCRFDWDSLSGDDARELWEELADWVYWLRNTYQLDTKIKPCWFRHRAAREELTALMVAHVAVYKTEPDARDSWREDLTAWHNQWMRPTVDVLARMMSDCTQSGCKHIVRAPVVDIEMRDFITEDVAARSNDDDVEPEHDPGRTTIPATEMTDLLNRGRAAAVPGKDPEFEYVELAGFTFELDPVAGVWNAVADL